MAHGKDPAFPLYARDFLTDARLWTINPADGFALVRLWSFLWTEGPQSLEAIRSAAPMLRCDPDTAERLALEFTEEDDRGRRFSRRLEAEREEREQIRERRSNAGKRGAAKRWGGKASSKANGKGTGQAMAEPVANGWPSASSSYTSTSNPSDVSRVPDSHPNDPSDPHPPTNAHGVPGGSDRVPGGGWTGQAPQEAPDSPVTASWCPKVSTHHPQPERAAQRRTGAFPGKCGSQRGPQSVGDLVGGIMRHIEGGAA